MAQSPHKPSYKQASHSAMLGLLSSLFSRHDAHAPLAPTATDLPKGSRLQRRLKSKVKRDHTFLSTVRNKRHQPSQLTQKLKNQRSQARMWQSVVVAAALGMSLGGTAWTSLFVSEQVTFAGVPYRIVHKFWNDKAARDAYFIGDRQRLHDRLKALGVEEDIKDYYRDRFANEHQLDQHIHQIMFNRTGYVGEAYNVNNFGQLSSIDY